MKDNLKRLQTARKELLDEMEQVRCKAAIANQEVSRLKENLEEVDSKIARLKSNPIVSEHAVLRYVERAMEIDIDEIKRRILSDETKQRIQELGSGKFPIGDGLRAVVKGNVVVTVE